MLNTTVLLWKVSGFWRLVWVSLF